MADTEATTDTNLDLSGQLLLVEDDVRLAASIREYLQNNQFTVAVEHRGDSAVELILSTVPDLVILDLMLPGIDGLEVCRQVRRDYPGPILMLTARDDTVEQVVGLEVGADDYVTKPVEPRLLLARIRALLRHANRIAHDSTDHSNSQLRFGSFSINQSNRQVLWRGEEIVCTAVEFELIWYLAKNAGRVISRDSIFQTLNGYQYDGLDRSVDIRISKLRKKFEDDASCPMRIKTIRGKGYLFVESAWD